MGTPIGAATQAVAHPPCKLMAHPIAPGTTVRVIDDPEPIHVQQHPRKLAAAASDSHDLALESQCEYR